MSLIGFRLMDAAASLPAAWGGLAGQGSCPDKSFIGAREPLTCLRSLSPKCTLKDENCSLLCP